MNVQELINELAKFRADALVVFCHHEAATGTEYRFRVETVARTSFGEVGINWSEDANPSNFIASEITDD